MKKSLTYLVNRTIEFYGLDEFMGEDAKKLNLKNFLQFEYTGQKVVYYGLLSSGGLVSVALSIMV